jgi:hypothetical protein
MVLPAKRRHSPRLTRRGPWLLDWISRFKAKIGTIQWIVLGVAVGLVGLGTLRKFRRMKS